MSGSHRTLRMERLEPRVLLAGAEPTPYEQYLLELVNQARLDPAAAAAWYDIGLNHGLPAGTISADPKPPLAFSTKLVAAAHAHSAWMLATDEFDHIGSGGSLPIDRMRAAGYQFVAPGGYAENIAAMPFSDMTTTTEWIHAEFLRSSEHRENLMNAAYRETGMGLTQGAFTLPSGRTQALVATEDFAYSGTGRFLTGVVYDDLLVRGDQLYTPGEGLGGVTIKATRKTDGAVFSTSTWASGGYTLPLGAGAYTVVATGGPLGNRIATGDVQIGSRNVKIDFTPAQAIEPVSLVDLSLVRKPTATGSVGEVNALPSSEAWIDEWDTCYVEIWVSTPEAAGAGIASAAVNLAYHPACFTVATIEYGPAFSKSQTGVIDDAAGIVRELGAATLRTDLGRDRYVLLARVKLDSSTPGDAAGLRIAPHAYPTARDNGVGASGARVTLTNGAETTVTYGGAPKTELWPVMYDLDDDGEVALGDLAYFAAAYHHMVDGSGIAYAQSCDFDHDGEVGLGDLSFFAAAYHREHTDPEPIAASCPPNFPGDWRDTVESLAAGQAAPGVLPGSTDVVEAMPVASLRLSWSYTLARRRRSAK